MEHFSQVTLLFERKFTLKNNGIKIDFSNKNGAFSMYIEYNKIASRRMVSLNIRFKRVIIAYVLICGLMISGTEYFGLNIGTTKSLCFLSMFILISALFYYYIKLVKCYKISIKGNRYFKVYYNIPSKSAAAEFIDELYERRKQYYQRQFLNTEYLNNKDVVMDKIKF